MAATSIQPSVGEKIDAVNLSTISGCNQTTASNEKSALKQNLEFISPETPSSGVLLPHLPGQTICKSSSELKVGEQYNYATTTYSSPCLPVSKGCIKKTAQTRFVNSSPRSYRLMPASVESSDMISFVEKSSHSHTLPMFMLDVADLWKLSKKSEWECNFTLAQSKQIGEPDDCVEEAKNKTPICHPSVIPTHTRQKRQCHGQIDFLQEISNATLGKGLFSHVKKFFSTQGLKNHHPMGIAGFMKSDSRSNKEARFLNHHLYIEDPELIHDKHSLTPLVKRLSVSGFDETLESKDKTHEKGVLNQYSLCRKAHTSSKRPSQKLCNSDEPLQKRANCAPFSVHMDVT